VKGTTSGSSAELLVAEDPVVPVSATGWSRIVGDAE
jgi:hypothetical protein